MLDKSVKLESLTCKFFSWLETLLGSGMVLHWSYISLECLSVCPVALRTEITVNVMDSQIAMVTTDTQPTPLHCWLLHFTAAFTNLTLL